MLDTKPKENIKDDLFDRATLVERILSRIHSDYSRPNLFAIYARWGSGKTTMLNFCGNTDKIEEANKKPGNRKGFWLQPFETWKYDNVDNLALAMMWHIKKVIPFAIKQYNKTISESDMEEVKKSIQRIGVALTMVSLDTIGYFCKIGPLAMNIKRGLETADTLIPLKEDLDQTPTFKICNQIQRVEDEFKKLGQLLCKKLDVDFIVVPIDDMDRCRPEHAINLLFLMKNLLISEHFCFVAAVDREAMTECLKLTYKMPIDDARWFMEKIFDDWVELPPPTLHEILDGISPVLAEEEESEKLKKENKEKLEKKEPDEPIYTEEIKLGLNASYLRKEEVEICINRIRESDILSIVDNPRKFIRGCQRFERFLAKKFPVPRWFMDHVIGYFGWFVIYSSNPEVVESLVILTRDCQLANTEEKPSELTAALDLLSFVALSTASLDEKQYKDRFKKLEEQKRVIEHRYGIILSLMIDPAKTSDGFTDHNSWNRECIKSAIPSIPDKYISNAHSPLLQFLRIADNNKLLPQTLAECLEEAMLYF